MPSSVFWPILTSISMSCCHISHSSCRRYSRKITIPSYRFFHFICYSRYISRIIRWSSYISTIYLSSNSIHSLCFWIKCCSTNFIYCFNYLRWFLFINLPIISSTFPTIWSRRIRRSHSSFPSSISFWYNICFVRFCTIFIVYINLKRSANSLSSSSIIICRLSFSPYIF